jgi:two-component sensor histidine kinase
LFVHVSPSSEPAEGENKLSEQSKTSAFPRSAKIALAFLVGCAVAGLPFAQLPGPEMPGVTAVFCAGLFVTELATGLLLLVRFSGERRPWLAVLVCAYFFSTLMAVLYLLTFPGALMPSDTLIGGGQAASWLFVAWTFGTPIAAIAAAFLEMRQPHLVLDWSRASRMVSVGIALTFTLAALLTTIVVEAPTLPSLIAEGRWTGLFMIMHAASTACMLLAVVVIAMGPGKRSDLFAWFAVSLMAMAVANLFAAVGGERYSLGWTAARVGYGVGAGTLFGFFLWLFAKQQRLLANARERLEADVAARTAELRQMVGERDTLLGEVYHRVNNNLQVLRSILYLERRDLATGHEAAALGRMDRRVLSIGVVHRRAMQTRLADDIDMGAVINELGRKMRDLMALDSRGICIEVHAAPVRLKLDLAVPLGLLIQELVASMAERIGPATTVRTILITLEEIRDVRRLVVAIGEEANSGSSTSLENVIIASLIGQLEGREEYGSGVSGSRVVVF